MVLFDYSMLFGISLLFNILVLSGNSKDPFTDWLKSQGSKFSFRQTCPAGQVLPKIHSSLRKIYLPCFSGVKMKKMEKKKLKINHCFIDTEAKHVNEYG